MSTTTIEIVTEQQWLAERAKDVTSTEVAALYGLTAAYSDLLDAELGAARRGLVLTDADRAVAGDPRS